MKNMGKSAEIEIEHEPVSDDSIQALQQKLARYEQQFRQMALINDIAEAANNTSDPKDAMAHTLSKICEDTGWPLASAFVVGKEDAQPVLTPAGIWHISDQQRFSKFVAISNTLRFTPGEGLPGIVYRDAEALWATAVKSDTVRLAAARNVGLRSAFAFPILIGREVVAVLEFFSENDSAPDEIVLDTVSKLSMLLGRVFERRRASVEREQLNNKLVLTSRQAGMAEVASGVLHNVGNALNSVTVSATVATDTVQNSYISGLDKVAALLNQNKADLVNFLTDGEKSEKLLNYINQLAKQLHDEQRIILEELQSLLEHIEHIKNIVRRQQHYAKPTSVKERTCLQSIIEDALKMNDLDHEDHPIEVIRDFESIPDILSDKHNIIQILNNLIGNTKHALRNMDRKAVITLRSRLSDDGKTVRIDVADNGCGIPKDLQHRMFSFGFTTKEMGHGFGLHMSANTAKAMGGTLSFVSEGEDKGTTFTLELPFIPCPGAQSDKGGIAA
jgi:signal transduction histidine kinase